MHVPAKDKYRRGLTILFISLLVAFNGAFASPTLREAPFSLPQRAEVRKLRGGVLKTSLGEVRFRLFPEEAPWHVANFKYLADKGFYRGKTFHLFLDGYIIQGGAVSKSEAARFGYSIPPEFSSREHLKGSLGMARLPNVKNPGRSSSGTQFHILLRDEPRMDGNYTVFGEVTEGMEVVQRLRQGDRIEDIIVYVSD